MYFPFRINQPKPPNSFSIIATHPICDDPGITDDLRSREGHLRSHEVTIHFLPITLNRTEKETRKWFQTA